VLGHIGSIVKCNAPLVEGLDLAALDAPNRKLEMVFLALRDDVASGLSISEAMRGLPRFFPAHYCDLVKAGEETGRLYEVIHGLNEHNAAQRALRESRNGWFAYIAVVGIVQFSLFSFIVTFVMPVFSEVYQDFGSQLPGIVGWLITALPDREMMIAVFGALGVVLLLGLPVKKWFYMPHRKKLTGVPLDKLAYCLPGFHGAYVGRNTAHIAGVLAKLLRAGVPIDVALNDCVELDVSLMYAGALSRIRDRVVAGESLSESFGKEFGFPRGFCEWIALGEESGMLPDALDKAADLYHRRALRNDRILTETLIPLCVLLLGIIPFVLTTATFRLTVDLADALINSM
jgi:type II secretory pathway component PulF